jgi:diadenosine tetraphosphate (Ap4A) HIT family hydrolase
MMSTGIISSPTPAKIKLSDCQFCRHLADADSAGIEWTVMAETENLVAVPSIGALVNGWLLVVPKNHHLNFGDAIRRSPGLVSEMEEIAARWEATFGPITWFEHGPKQAGTKVGCSIDHAHMHLVPLGRIDLLAAARDRLGKASFTEISGFSALADAIDRGCSYLYIRLPDGTQWLEAANAIPSQSLRRVIAAEQGRAQEWDWKAFPRPELVHQTIARATSPA